MPLIEAILLLAANMSIFSIDDLVGLLVTTLLIPLIIIMHRRGQRKLFPFFFAYLLVVLFKSEALQLIQSFSPKGYFYGYWIAEPITIVLSFTVIYEIYSHILTSGTLPIGKTAFFRINVGLLLFASLVAALTVHPAGNPLLRTIFVLTSTLRTMQVGLFIFLVSLSVFYGFYWTGQAFGIALGYGLYALAQLANTVVRSWVGSLGDRVYAFVTVAAYACAVLIWLAYAMKRKEMVHLRALPKNNTAVWFGALERLTK